MKGTSNNTLIITNGDSAVNIMQEACIPGVFLPWRDILHDGPVPSGLSYDELSGVRADFIISQGWGKPEDIKRSFTERGEMLESFAHYKKVLLWFEHDLYDQLQILQLLDWFSEQELGDVALTMICTEQYLGMCTPDEMKTLLTYEEPVAEVHLLIAKQAWAAYREPTPEKWQSLLHQDTSALPFLRDAVLRILEEYPSISDGLGRTARTALHIIADGETNLWKIFERYQDSEKRRFMGDYSFWMILNQMITSKPPCLHLPDGGQLRPPVHRDGKIEITQTGRDLLAGKLNWLELHPIDQWIGGVHLKTNNLWCWDDQKQEFV